MAPLLYVPVVLYAWSFPGAVWARVATAAGAACIVGMVLRERATIGPGRDPVASALVLSLFVAGIGAVGSVAPHRSVFGNFTRLGGLVGGVHLVVWYGLLRTVLDDEGWRRALQVVTGVTLVSAVGAVLQWLHLYRQGAEELRANFPLDNPGQLGLLMILGACAALTLAGDRETRGRWRVAAISTAGLAVGAMLASGSRAAIPALAAGLAVGGIVWLLRSRGLRLSKRVWALAGSIVLAAGLLVMTHFMRLGVSVPGLDRVTGAVQHLERRGSAEIRLVALEAAGAAIRERPLTGWGPENFQITFDRLADPGRPYRLDRPISYGRAHNFWAEAGVAVGVAGLLAALALAGAVLWVVLGAARSEEATGPLEAASLAGGVMAYGVFLLFWFQGPAVAALGLAIVAFAAHRREGRRWLSKRDEGEQGGGNGGMASSEGAALVAAILAAAVAAHSVLLVRPARELREAAATEQLEEAVGAYERALDARMPGSEEVVIRYGEMLAGLAERVRTLARRPGGEVTLDAAFATASPAVARQIERDPKNARLRSLQAGVRLAEARFRGSPDLIHGAVESMARAVELAPGQLYYRYMLAEMLRITGRHRESIKVLLRAVAVAPRVDETRLHLSRAHLAAGRPDSAAVWLMEGKGAIDSRNDTLLVRRLLGDLPRDGDRAREIRALLGPIRDQSDSDRNTEE